MKIGLMALATLVPFAFATAAQAAPAETPNPFARDQAVLELKDLDLASVDGQQRLAIRMDQAARSVCGEGMASVHLAAGAKARECRAAVMSDIRTRIETRMAAGSVPARIQFASAR